MPLIAKFKIASERTVYDLPAFSEEARATAFQCLAAKRIAEIDDENARAAGRVIPRQLFVDNAEATSLARTKSTSIIVARWSVGVAAVDWIWETLRIAGPKLAGHYRASARMYIDGVESRDPRDAVGAREVLFVSIVPYARKIERGKKGYAPGHVYRAGLACLDSSPRILSGSLPGFAERGAFRFCRGGGRA
ncbi:hypothetical protein [Methylocystis iwaonis]|uniref:Uncharacterized protein n=1 Tax=Methylocystis iwaonis TaxID=2885079 RepID=A0ABN6VEA0_9HYPH|nr:hypothetical protein [Methylocystis iwaonis]BDV33921.1 hypothetical protein SS37A_14500 [Methylocystis iwaonis]